MKNLIATILFVTSVSSGSLNLYKDDFKYAQNESSGLLDIQLNQIGWFDNAEYINAADGQVRFYRYTFQVVGLYSDDDAILQNTNYLYFDLPLDYLSYDDTTTAVNLCIYQLADDSITVKEVFDALPIIPLFPTLAVFDTSSNYILMPDEKIQFIIPTTHTTPISRWQEALNDVHIYNRSGLLNAFAPIYSEGYNTGFNDGEYEGYFVGYDDGYNEGVESGINENVSYSWLRGLFYGLGDLLSIRLFGDITIGSIALIMLSLTLLPFIIGLAKGKGRD